MQADVPDNNVIVFDFGEDTLGTMDTGYVSMAQESPSMELFGTDGAIPIWGGDQVMRIRLYKDDWKTDVAGWQDVDISGMSSRWAQHPATLLSLADAVLDGKPLLNGPRHIAHVVEIMEKTWESAESGRALDLKTTFRVPDWEELPFEATHP